MVKAITPSPYGGGRLRRRVAQIPSRCHRFQGGGRSRRAERPEQFEAVTRRFGPIVVISGGPNTGMVQPNGIAFDSSENLYVANCGPCGHGQNGPGSSEVFVPGSNGNIAPNQDD
jgi:hypothetical protein